MASIGDNTGALQDILTAVQNLPEGGGSSDFESGEWVVPNGVGANVLTTICRLKAYPRVFVLLSSGISTASSWFASAMYCLDSYDNPITSSSLMYKIYHYINSSGTKGSSGATETISTTKVGCFAVTSDYDVKIIFAVAYPLRAGTYKWYAIY